MHRLWRLSAVALLAGCSVRPAFLELHFASWRTGTVAAVGGRPVLHGGPGEDAEVKSREQIGTFALQVGKRRISAQLQVEPSGRLPDLTLGAVSGRSDVHVLRVEREPGEEIWNLFLRTASDRLDIVSCRLAWTTETASTKARKTDRITCSLE